MSEDTPQTEKCIDRRTRTPTPTNTCSECGHEYLPSDSRSVVIRGPSEVYCGCPECGYRSLGIIPVEVAHLPDDLDTLDADENEEDDP